MQQRNDDIAATLSEVFGYSEFRSPQREIIEHVIGGGDAFVLMPTGGGKSLCYQIPALHRQGTAIVVSPLISLMKDQVDALRANGVAAAYLNSSLDAETASQVFRDLRSGALDLLYVSPERLMIGGFLDVLTEIEVALFAIDEAHCVSTWGHDFRPEYVALGSLRRQFPHIPLIALTATADEQTRADIRSQLSLENAAVYVCGFDRPNISYTVVEKRKAPEQLTKFVLERAGDSGIVYCLSRKQVEKVAAVLKKAGVPSGAYHAGFPQAQRARVQDSFLRGDIDVVVATVAFGMGIDKPDVRFVVHYDMPKNIEGFYQETGRAGRDGLPAEALLFYSLQDATTARRLVESGNNPEQVRIEIHKLQAMIGLAEATTCRRRVLLGYFGETVETDCGNCDVCANPPELYDGTIDAQKVLSAVYRLRESFGIGYVIDVLRGSGASRIAEYGHDRLSVFGIGAEYSKDEWALIIRQLIHHGYLIQDIAAYSVLRLTPAARAVLVGEQQVMIAKPVVAVAAKSEATKGGRARTFGGSKVDSGLFERLRVLRHTMATEQQVPAYVIFSDATLMDMSVRRPSSEEEFLSVSGVGKTKMKRHGARFMDEIATWVAEVEG